MFRHVRIAVLLVATLLISLSNVVTLGLCSCASGWERFFIGTCACFHEESAGASYLTHSGLTDDLCDSAESARSFIASNVAHLDNEGHCHHLVLDSSDPYRMSTRQQTVRPPLLCVIPLYATPWTAQHSVSNLLRCEGNRVSLPSPPLLSSGGNSYDGWQCPMRA